jgi:hypothetical protein
VTQVRTLEEVVRRAASERRFQTMVLLLFTSLARGLALGASRGDILTLVIGRAMLLVGARSLAERPARTRYRAHYKRCCSRSSRGTR